MTNAVTVAPQQKASALAVMASAYSVDSSKLLETLRQTVFKNATNEELMALVVVANTYHLNPFTREIYAFPKKGGGIQPVVSIDGWIKMMHSDPRFDGIEFAFAGDDDDMACTATIYVKGLSRPCAVTEYLSECYRDTDPWRTCKRRMLRHKALIQCARVAFGFGGVMDPEEGETVRVVVDPPEPRKRIEAPRDDVPMAFAEAKPATADPRGELQAKLSVEGLTFQQFRDACEKAKILSDPSAIGCIEDIAPADCKRLLRAWPQIAAQIGGAA